MHQNRTMIRAARGNETCAATAKQQGDSLLMMREGHHNARRRSVRQASPRDSRCNAKVQKRMFHAVFLEGYFCMRTAPSTCVLE